MPTTPSTINYYIAADGTLRDGSAGSIAQTPRIYYGTEYAVTLSFPPSTIAEGDQLQVAVNRTRTFFSSASATGDAPVAAVAKHEVTAEEADAQAVTLTLSTNTRAMIDQVNGIDHPVRGFFGVHILKNQSFVTLAVADAFMMSVESGPDAISPSLPVVDYPTREEAEALTKRSENAADRAEQAAAGIVPPLQLSAPPTTSTVGSIGQLATWHDGENNKDHLYHLVYITTSENATLYHWEECVLVSQGNVAGGYAALDENGKIASSQLPTMNYIPTSEKGAANGVAPLNEVGTLTSTKLRHGGEFFGLRNFGIWDSSVQKNIDALVISPASEADINTHTSLYKPIVPARIAYAVRSVLPKVTEIPAATSDYSLVDSSATTLNHSHTFVHTPTQAPTYRLPSVSDTTVSHYIELTVDFTNVQTYSFLDSNGDALVPLFTPSIAAGDVYTFKMEYSAIKAKWLIYPQKQGAVADDFVVRGEVGAALGVAGLNANAKVLRNNLPIADNTLVGCIRVPSWGGISLQSDGGIAIGAANASMIDQKTALRNPIVPYYLNYAVISALTASNHITLNDAQKATAQSVFGVGGPITAIPAATSQYTLSYGRFSHVPELASTYVLPAVADGTLANDIVLSIKFSSSVLTYEFQDSAGTTLVPLPLNGDIEAGSVVTFLCRYQPLLSQWVIYPVMDGKEAE